MVVKYYLSSWKFGDCPERLAELAPANRRIGVVHNARDHTASDPDRARQHLHSEMETLAALGFEPEVVDLKVFFEKTDDLRAKLAGLGALWVGGGNTFVLRQAMRLSGFDQLFPELMRRPDFLWGGYSAGICILSDTLRPIDGIDDPFDFPYAGLREPLYEGLGVFHYTFLPHYRSLHPESELVEQAVQRCIEEKWLFKTLRDGEVLILEV